MFDDADVATAISRQHRCARARDAPGRQEALRAAQQKRATDTLIGRTFLPSVGNTDRDFARSL